MKHVVADLYQLFQLNGKYVKDQKQLQRKGAKVPVKIVEDNNRNWQDTGLLYEVDLKATDEFNTYLEKKQVKREELKRIKQAQNASILSDAMNAVVEQVVEKKAKKQKTE